MADYDSSLPIRTQNPGDVQMKLVDGSNTAQVLKIEADGSINANISTGDLDVRDLAFATDKVDVSGSSVDVANFPQSFEVSNFPQSFDVSNFPQSFEVSNFPQSFEVSNASIAVTATDLDIRALSAQGGDTVGALVTDGAGNFLSIDAQGKLSVKAENFDIRDLAHGSDSVTAHLAAGSQIEISNASMAVTGSDFDIRDLQYGSDSVTAHLAAGSQVEISNASLAVTASGLDIRQLSMQNDSVTAQIINSSGIALKLDNLGRVDIVATDLDIRTIDKDSDSITAHLAAGSQISISNASLEVTAQDLDVRDLAYATDSVTAHFAAGSQVGISGSVTVEASDLDIRGLTYGTDQVGAFLMNGMGQSILNDTDSLNTRIERDRQDIAQYEEEQAVAGGGVAYNTLAPRAYDYYLKAFKAAASGRMKAELQMLVGGSWQTVAVAYNSSAFPNLEMELGEALKVEAGGQMRLKLTNRESEAMDMHSILVEAKELF